MSKTTITKTGIAKFIILSGIILCTSSGSLNALFGRTYVDDEGNEYHHRGLVGSIVAAPAVVVEGTADVVDGNYPSRHCRGRGDTDCYTYHRGRRYYRGERPVRRCMDENDTHCYRGE